jgi:putative spermidine/putrescine transport system substrate-binding protein
MPARTLLVAMALLSACPVAAMARDLTVVARGKMMQDSVVQAIGSPFTGATGIPLQFDSWGGGLDTLRSHLKAPDNSWDLVAVDPEELAAGCSEGLFEKLDWSAIGGKDHYLAQGVSECGVGAALTTLVLAWDRDKFAATPSWADFWDVAKYPGKRGLRKGVRGNLEFALIADGVAPADVYKVLGSSDGVDRAFRKLDQLKPYIVWWQSGAEAAHILSSGDVLLTTAPSGRIVTADRVDHRNFGIQWTAGLYQVKSWAVVKGSPDLRQATQFLYFAGMPAVEARLFENAGIGGLAKGTNEGLSPEMQALSPTNPANLSVAVRIDTGFWHDNLARRALSKGGGIGGGYRPLVRNRRDAPECGRGRGWHRSPRLLIGLVPLVAASFVAAILAAKRVGRAAGVRSAPSLLAPWLHDIVCLPI